MQREKSSKKARAASKLDKFDGSYIRDLLSKVYSFLDNAETCPILQHTIRKQEQHSNNPITSIAAVAGVERMGSSEELHMELDESSVSVSDATKSVSETLQNESVEDFTSAQLDAYVGKYVTGRQIAAHAGLDWRKEGFWEIRVDMIHQTFYAGQVNILATELLLPMKIENIFFMDCLQIFYLEGMHRCAELKYWSAVAMTKALQRTWDQYLISSGSSSSSSSDREAWNCDYNIPLLIRRIYSTALLNIAASKVKQNPFHKGHINRAGISPVMALAGEGVESINFPCIEDLLCLSACELCDLVVHITKDPVAAIRKHKIMSETKK